MTGSITVEMFRDEVEKTNRNIQIMNEAFGNLNSTNDKIFQALRSLRNDDVDKILGPTKIELERQSKRNKMLMDLWDRSGRGNANPTDLEIEFYSLYTNLLAVEEAFKKKYFSH